MKSIVFVALCAMSAWAVADNYVEGYLKKDGTYVQGHYQTDSNSTKTDNYSSQGNVNPHTGKSGTVDPYKPQQCGYTKSGNYVCR